MDFIKFVKADLKEYGVKYYLPRTKKIKCDGVLVSGYFDDTVPVLACAMKNEQAYEVLVHEYCHFTQWRDQCKPWVMAVKHKAFEGLWDFLGGAEVKNINRLLSLCRDVEEDNERRAVALIKKMQLDIDIDYYIKKANAYIHFYNWMKTSRRWCRPYNTPYTNKRLLDAMPTTFSESYTVLPAHIKQIFKEEDI